MQKTSLKKAGVPLLFITRAAIIAAIYFALSTAVQAIAFGPIQFRISEALVLLPVFMPEAIPGLIVGCFFTNFFFSPYAAYDMLFGTLATALGAVGTYLLRKNLPLSAIPPILFNALLVPLIWVCDGSDTIYYVAMFEIMASEVIICGIIGIPFTYLLRRALVAAHIVKLTPRKFDYQPYVRKTDEEEKQEEAEEKIAPFIVDATKCDAQSDAENASAKGDEN